jgi:hypothetical protein
MKDGESMVKIEGAQRDFSFGEIDVDFKRNDDHPARKAGLRQMRRTCASTIPAALQTAPAALRCFRTPTTCPDR